MNPVRGSSTSMQTGPADPARREFIKLGAGLTLGLSLAGLARRGISAFAAEEISTGKAFSANAWVNIAPDGTITIIAPADELGQGSMTALPIILAEELDADWDKVRIEFSPVDETVYGNPEFMGMIYTAASTAVSGYFQLLRQFGAQARRILLLNAAEKWGLPAEELSTEPSAVIHPRSGRRMSYGDIASFARLPESLPEISPAELKSPAEFRLIGHSLPRRDVPEKVRGRSPYALNVQLPGMVRATAVRAPIMRSRLAQVDDSGLKELQGAVNIFPREHSVIIAAESLNQALEARRRLRLRWEPVGEVDRFDSETALAEHARMASDLAIPGKEFSSQGDVGPAFGTATRTFDAQYHTDYVYHAQMEPLNATVWMKDDGSVEAWVGTQAPAATVKAIAKATGADAARILLHRAMLGGAFGRRSVVEMDFVDDAAWLSARLRKPVQVVWSREDDVAAGWFKPMTSQHLRAAVDAHGKISGWHHRIAVQEPLATAEPELFEKIHGTPIVSMPGTTDLMYDFPNQRVEHMPVEPGIRTYSLLGVGYTPNKFAVESFMDEIAAGLGADPLEFRLRQMEPSPRARRVLEAVAALSSWGGSVPEGRARGIAFAEYHHTLLAGVAEISVTEGRIRTHRFWVVVDPGLAVQPDNIRSQVMGAVIFALGGALTESISFRNGLVQQSNYHDYVIPRIGDTPEIHVEILAQGGEPSAVGQTAAVIVAPAIANAFSSLTGRRLRRTPFTRDRVLAALDPALADNPNPHVSSRPTPG